MITTLFYGYRGGTGRSLCLANCATHIANKEGRKVLVLDLDLEAGGLNYIYKQKQADFKFSTDAMGLVKCLINFDFETLPSCIEDLKVFDSYKDLNGNLDLLPIYVSPYLTDLILQKYNKPDLLKKMFVSLKTRIDNDFDYDYLFVDMPTGAGPIFRDMVKVADQIVMLSRPNLQGAFGSGLMMKTLYKEDKKVIFVLSSVPSPAENGLKIKDFQRYSGIIDEQLKAIIPFDTDMAFTEEIAVLTRPDSEIAKAYKSIADMITEGI